ncbi:hypothetical protein niasHT_019210 [Heterodera trifolii]|uniref:Uncharacterized protein n=1 Tax=Heterodera trifolii TaxID=157864 RepID=A0ABD2IYC8_9BILA
MKRPMDSTATPPSTKVTRISADALAGQIDSLSAAVNALLVQDDISQAVKLQFGVLLTTLHTCQHVIDGLNNNANNNSAEEQERRRSLVIIGLPENASTRPSERVREDQKVVSGILDELGVEAVPTTTYRMGRPDVHRASPRLVKVVLPASVHQHIALGGWKKERTRLRSLPNWGRLLIRPSLSREQLQAEYEQRQAKRNEMTNHPPNANTISTQLHELGRQMNQNFH